MTSICLGPFNINPAGLKLKVKMRDFKNINIFHSNQALKDGKGLEQINLYETQE